MSPPSGPWAQGPDDPEPRRPRARLLIWLALLLATAAGVTLLFRIFPGGVSTGEDWAWLARGVALVALVSAGILAGGRINWGQKARHAAIWAGIIAVLALGAAYRDELMGVGQRLRSEFSPSYAVATGPRELVVTQDEDGGFYVMGQVNGQPVRFLVDTGASEIVLSPADARRLGVNLDTLTFDHAAETANGVGYAAPFTADSLAVGSIRFDNVPVAINQAPMRNSLLGMSFLKRLDSFQVSGRKLYLKARTP
jgi:aspartyl protease family protein